MNTECILIGIALFAIIFIIFWNAEKKYRRLHNMENIIPEEHFGNVYNVDKSVHGINLGTVGCPGGVDRISQPLNVQGHAVVFPKHPTWYNPHSVYFSPTGDGLVKPEGYVM